MRPNWNPADDSSALRKALAESERHSEDLKRILLAIRRVNQLIVGESDPVRLIEKACQFLTEAVGCAYAWVILLDSSGRQITAVVSSGDIDRFSCLVGADLEGLPQCLREAMGSACTVVGTPAGICRSCPLAQSDANRRGLAHRLEFERQVLGVVVASVDQETSTDLEVLDFFSQLAQDLAFGLHRLQQGQALKESEQWFHLIFESSRDPVYVAPILDDGRPGRFWQVNQAACDRLGYSRDELLQLTPAEVDDVTLTDERARFIARLQADREATFETVHRTKAGERFPVEVNSRVFPYRGELMSVSVARDLSDRIKAEASLRLQASQYESILRTTRDGFWLVGLDGRLLDVNDGYCRLSGYARHELIGLTISDLEAGESPEETQLHLERLRATGFDYFETRHRAKDGRIYDVEISTTVWKETGQLIVFVRDITERKRTQEALQASERRFFNAFSYAPIGMALVSLEGRWLQVNASTCALLGRSEEDLQQLKVADLTEPEDHAKEAVLSQRLLQGELRSYQVEKRYLDAGGRTVWTSQGVSLVRNEIGSPEYLILQIQDVTARKLAEEERARMQEQLLQAQKMESVGRLAGGVAHDFNNMLGVIIGHSEMAVDQLPKDSPVLVELREIQGAALRSADLTRQLLGFARKQTVEPKVLDLNDIVAGMLKMLQRLIGEDIELVWMPGYDLWPVRIDPVQVDQVLANLCINARDAIEGIGSVTIETGNCHLAAEQLPDSEGCVPGEYVCLKITDTGAGMDTEVLSHLFEPFFTTKGVGKGTGLGLATVYGIARQNGGLVKVDSEPGKGSCFRICLPRWRGREASPPSGEPAKPVLTGMETVLLVEDEPAILRMGKTMLERLGYRVLAAGTPSDAARLAHLHAGEVRLLVTDVIMPEMNGKDLAAQLLARHPGLNVLFTSGYTADVIAQHGVLEDGVAFIQKPFSKRDLAEAVRKVLDSGTRMPGY